MLEICIATLITVAALFFLVRHFYRVFTGKKSACNCGTKKTAGDNTFTKQPAANCGCGCSGCKNKQPTE